MEGLCFKRDCEERGSGEMEDDEAEEVRTHLDETLGKTGRFEALLDALSNEGSLRRRLEENRVSGEELWERRISFVDGGEGEVKVQTAGMRALTVIM
jgi:hypothetical protein